MKSKIRKALQERSEERLVKRKVKFFQCHAGGYGEGDSFIGVDNPNVRAVAREFQQISIKNITALLRSSFHEERLLGLVIMDLQYSKADRKKFLNTEHQQKLFQLYLDEIDHINNWDLVDLSAPNIIGRFLLDKKKERTILYELAASQELWKERIAIIATYCFIRNRDYADTLKLAEQFLTHKHDLMHKATGWMLREIGKRDLNQEKNFLQKHYRKMPRTALRYAIEKFPEDIRKAYLKGEI